MSDKTQKMYSVTEVAKILGLSRMQVLRKIKKGEIEAHRIGKSFVIPSDSLPGIYKPLSSKDKKLIEEAVDRTFKEYREVIEKLGKE